MSVMASLAAKLSLLLPKPLHAYCDLESVDGRAFVTTRGDYVSLVRVQGITRMVRSVDIDQIVESLRIDLQGSLEQPGHSMQASYACDPRQSEAAVRHHLEAPRAIARELGMRLDDILSERETLLPQVMRWESCDFVLWSRAAALLTSEEASQTNKERIAAAKGAPKISNTRQPAQNIFLASEILAAKHAAFVQKIIGAFRLSDIVLEEVMPREALVRIRQALYPETTDSDWQPVLPGDKTRLRMPEPGETPKPDHVLWPSLRGQIFLADAFAEGTRVVTIGDNEWTSIDITLAPEDARPFAELVARLASAHLPWRVSFWIEGGGRTGMGFKALFAEILAFEPNNKSIAAAFTALKQMKEATAEVPVRWRATFATWTPVGDRARLRRNAATLAQRIQSWGNCQVGMIAGDPLDGVMGSALGLTFGTPAPAALAPLSQAIRMLPWGRPASPWKTGSVLFRSPDGRIFPYDPSGAGRGAVFALFIAPPRHGKSTLANAINLGLCLSRAGQGSDGARLPLIGKLDIGDSAEGFIMVLREALPEDRRDEAVFVRMQFAPGYEYNIFDTQLGCRRPLPLEKMFLKNFLSMANTSLEDNTLFEGMDDFIGFVIDEAYRMFGDEGPNLKTKRYEPEVEPEVDEALARLGIEFRAGPDNAELIAEPWWWDVVDRLCMAGEYRLAEIAQRHAVPLLDDLITAARSPQALDKAKAVKSFKTSESLREMFERNISALIQAFPTLNRRTRLNFGQARVIVLNLERVVPKGGAANDRQTSLMFMLGRHILAKNFFLHSDYLSDVPPLMKAYHSRRFAEIQEAIKRLDIDEYHRTAGAPSMRAQVVRDALEGPKHNIQLAITSQSIKHFDAELIDFSTERFILGAGSRDEATEIAARFQLSEAAAWIVANRLKGPDRNGGGAPFLAVIDANNQRYEQMLVNSLGPVELWALSTTPLDVHLRNRLYRRLGPSEARRRLALVFPHGTAVAEINRRKDERLKAGDQDERAIEGVIDELAGELSDGRGLGMMLREAATAMPAQRLAAE